MKKNGGTSLSLQKEKKQRVMLCVYIFFANLIISLLLHHIDTCKSEDLFFVQFRCSVMHFLFTLRTIYMIPFDREIKKRLFSCIETPSGYKQHDQIFSILSCSGLTAKRLF